MGANQSAAQGVNVEPARNGFTLVNPSPNAESDLQKITLPPRVKPILTVDNQTIDNSRHGHDVQLDSQPWLDLVATIDEFSSSRAGLVGGRQTKLQEKIIQLDSYVQKFTDSYINEKHRALANMKDDCRKVDELKRTLEKCTIQSEVCIDMLNKLNFLLPEEYKLEPLEI